MTIEFIPTRGGHSPNPDTQQIIDLLRGPGKISGITGGVIYYGWPRYTDYDDVRHYVDLAVLGPGVGIVLIRVLPGANERTIGAAADSLSQASAGIMAQLLRSPRLRSKGRRLTVPVFPVLLTPGNSRDDDSDDDIPRFAAAAAVVQYMKSINNASLTDDEISEARSILEGAKSLARPVKRIIENPNNQPLAVALNQLEEEIASFDSRQRTVALNSVGGPQRIRGLAGSGKTVILAMRAALAHLDDPTQRILVTFYTRSLRDHLTRLIGRFHRHFGQGEPDWSKIHIYHGWGRKDLPGVLREASIRAGVLPIAYGAAVSGAARGEQPFDFACRALIESGTVTPFYDLVLIDEGQDFPDNFYRLCFLLAKGDRDSKQIVWAYDELQNVFNVNVRTPEELFGEDLDGQPKVSLSRSLPANAETNDFVLPKCYRNQRDTLVLAHAIGFGIYGTPVQMLQGKGHWEDVGYDVEAPNMRPGTAVVIDRPERNSPTTLQSPANVALVDVELFENAGEEARYCADQIKAFIDGGLEPEDCMVIAIDDRAAQSYLSIVAEMLAESGILTNNIIADRYSEPAFRIEGKVTLSTVYRAKGNEAACVLVLGCDAVPLRTRNGRNRLFAAFTRSKGWLRITGMGAAFKPLKREIKVALQNAPQMSFVMPDPNEIEMIQRDLSEKDARLQRAQAELERMREEFGLTDEDLQVLVREGRRGGRR